MVPPPPRSDLASARRVGYLLWMYPRFHQTFILNEILELARQGLDLRIVSMNKPDEGRIQELACRVRAQVDYLPETVTHSFRKTRRVHGSLLWSAPRAYLRAAGAVLRHARATPFDLIQAGHLVRWARKNHVDLVHVHDFRTHEATVALLAHILDGLPYSLALHAGELFRRDADRPLLVRKINHSLFTLVNCEFSRRFLIQRHPGVDAGRIRVIYNGVDLERFKPAPHRPPEPTLLSVGRLVEKKGFIHLIRAIRRLRTSGFPVRCRIVGDGPQRRTLQEAIEQNGLSSLIQLTGVRQQKWVRTLMERSRGLVLPCVPGKDGNLDGIPNVLLEALACRCPVVSTRLSGIPELIEDRITGLLVEPGDEIALASAIHDILTDSDLATRLAANGRRRIEQQFALRSNVRVIHEWLVSAAQDTGAPSFPLGKAGALSFPSGFPQPGRERGGGGTDSRTVDRFGGSSVPHSKTAAQAGFGPC